MAFCSFSKDCDGNSYVTVENKFITKYLPEADGFAVKVYLYGLYLCKNASDDFGLKAMAEVLKCSEEKIEEAFAFWEEYDLVQVVSKLPFAVQYLPVKATVGKPKKVRYEQYADFNKELQRKMQRVGKFVSAGDYLKYMRFLDENPMQPQALLLIAEYCINKQGESASASYIFNKAKKLLREGLSTYEQVERELSNYHENESEIASILNQLGGYKRAPTEADYSLYRKWTETLKFEKESVLAAAKCLKRGNMNTLDITLEELYEKGVKNADEVGRYLMNREILVNLTFRIARKLGATVSNPTAYVEEYVEKWKELGFDDSSLLDIALYCLKTERGSFDFMHSLIEKLSKVQIVSVESVKAYIKEQNDDLKLLGKIQELCGTIRKSAANLAYLKTWRDWGFGEAVILEAAKRSSTSTNPLSYMNKILSEWKQAELFDVKKLPAPLTTHEKTSSARGGFQNPSIEAANAKSDRERFYALRREKAQAKADKFLAKANENPRFKQLSSQLSKMELALAKAEVFKPETLPSLQAEKQGLLEERAKILSEMRISEADLAPKFICKKCMDTGFLKNGAACDCYKNGKSE